MKNTQFERKFRGGEKVRFCSKTWRVTKSIAPTRDSYNHVWYPIHRGPLSLDVRGDKLTKIRG